MAYRSSRRNWGRAAFAALAMLGVFYSRGGAPVQAQTGAPTSWVCFPTCSEIDGRFLVIAGVGTGSLAGQSVSIGLFAAPLSTSLNVSIFDGDSSGGDNDRGGKIAAAVQLERTERELTLQCLTLCF